MTTGTFQANKSTIVRQWHLIDAKGQVLGRVATEISQLLIGKSKITYTPHVDGGDNVVVLNADKIILKGNNKGKQKMDFRHSGYLGGTTFTPYEIFMKEKPERAVWLAVKGMLPKNRLRNRRLARVKVYRGDSHPHIAHFRTAKPKEPRPAVQTEQGSDA